VLVILITATIIAIYQREHSGRWKFSMVMPVQREFGLRSVYCKSLLPVLLIFSLFACVLSGDVVAYSLGDVVHVATEVELWDAVNSARSGVSMVVALDGDIFLSESLVISAHKHITLMSNDNDAGFRLIGASEAATIVVKDGGVLGLAGIVITHNKNTYGRGVEINSGGTLDLLRNYHFFEVTDAANQVKP
jgi:hypothetical protein